MPRGQKTTVEFSSFSGGINTEASFLNFPADSTLDEINFEIARDGSRKRRKGIKQEQGGLERLTNLSPYADPDTRIQTFLWKNAGGSSESLVLIRIGEYIFFYQANKVNPSAYPKFFLEFPSTLRYDEFSFTSINGNGVLSTKRQKLTVISRSTLGGYYTNYALLTVRDNWGVLGYSDGARPSTINYRHKYNLYNGGWPESAKVFTASDGSSSGYGIYLLDQFKARGGAYPARNDIHYAFKGTAAASASAVGAYNPYLMSSLNFGSSKPITGHYIIDPFNRGDSRRSKLTGLSTEYTEADSVEGGISVVSSYAGRVFYGIEVIKDNFGYGPAPSLGQTIFFSKVNPSVADLGECYAQNDPTVEDLGAPLDTDGGYITITEMGKILAMEALGDTLFVFANNGVWSISGGDRPFSSTNIHLSKVSSEGALSRDSIVPTEDSIVYLGTGGIYRASLDSVSLVGVSTNISLEKVQKLYLSIPFTERENIKGIYLNGAKQIRWLFRDTTTPNKNMFNKELIYDAKFNSFTVFKFGKSKSNLDPYVVGYMPVADFATALIEEEVTVNGDTVYSDADIVTVETEAVSSSTSEGIQYVTMRRNLADANTSYHTVSGLDNESFLDWEDVDGVGVDAAGFLLTGGITGGDTTKEKQLVHLITHMRLTDELINTSGGEITSVNPSGCFVRGVWEWTTSADTGRWSNRQQVYRLSRFKPVEASDVVLNYGYSIVTSKTKIRGSGRAVSLLFETEPNKDCHILGWALSITGNES